MVGEDGYSLWLGYERASESIAAEYSDKIKKAVVFGVAETDDTIADELEKALPVILGLSVSKFQIERGDSESDDISAFDGLLVIGAYDALPACLQAQYTRSEIPGEDGYLICSVNSCFRGTLVTSLTQKGVLYGTFAFLRLLQTESSISNLSIQSVPKLKWRMLNHWDNLDRSVERGYAGQSIWKWKELPKKIDPRYDDYGRACASIGLNASVLNNVNTQPEIISLQYIKKAAAIADVLRKYGIRILLSVNFASPISVGGLKTADPFDEGVQAWWKAKIAEIYSYIPDFGGFLIKADSEGQPGPFAYGRTHADGANMLAKFLSVWDGIVVWRAFVYGHGENDRAKKAYANFKPLDGQFLDNTAVQVKNGAIDFQPREPVHPLFGGLKKTNIFMEFQITQEYLGQGNHLVFLAPMWKEILEFDTYADGKGSTVGKLLNGIAAVANTGDDSTWCGSLFHPANWYAYGRLAWDYTLESETIAREWTTCTWGTNPIVAKAVMSILMNSWEACVNYMTPLCLHHIMKYGHHYGPDPACNEGQREDWKPKYYHRADKNGLGFDRTRSGSDAVDQYYTPVADTFNDITTCPEKYLLWFHHVPWNYVLSSGRKLRDELVFLYEKGVLEAEQLRSTWVALEQDLGIDFEESLGKARFTKVLKKLNIQVKDAYEWRDVCVPYFMSFANMKGDDVKVYRNVFAEYGYSQTDIDKRLNDDWNTMFEDATERIYFNADNATQTTPATGYMVDTGNNDVRTEGMSYGMMMAVQMDKKEVFDRLWAWTMKNMYMDSGPFAGYFAWSCALDGSKNAYGPAPDGEEYFALSLFFASHRWGDGEGIFEYSKQAQSILHTCLHGKVPMWNKSNNYIQFVPGCPFTDPSYHLPHFYDLFALWANSEDQDFWKKAAEASRLFLPITCHPDTGLAPEYAYNDGTPNPDGPPAGHGYFYSDAYRVASNIALDALWTGSRPDLQAIAEKIQAFFTDVPPEKYMTYQVDGLPVGIKALHPTGLIATLAAATVACRAKAGKKDQTSINADKAVKLFWDTPLRKGERRYYDNCLYFFALLILSGKYRIY